MDYNKTNWITYLSYNEALQDVDGWTQAEKDNGKPGSDWNESTQLFDISNENIKYKNILEFHQNPDG